MSRVRTAPRKEPRQARSLATVEAILVATARVLTRDGYDRASTNKIAAEAGVSVGSLYQYFPSKEALVAALVDRHLSHVTALLETNIEVLAEAPLPVSARALVKLMIAVHAHNPRLHKVIVEQVPRVGRLNRIYDIERQIGERIHAMFDSLLLWGLAQAYNPAALNGKRLLRHRYRLWISRASLLRHYGRSHPAA